MEQKNLILLDAILPKIENKTLALLRDLILIFSFALLTGICAKLKIEIGPVPITMQTFAVLLSGAILGSIRGALSQLVYLILGLARIPWFSRGGGISYLLSPTFGFIIGFVLAAYLVGFLCERGWERNVKKSIFAMALGNIVLYLPGLFWLAKFFGFKKALRVGLYPFIIGDTLKLLLAGSLLPFAWKVLKNDKKKSKVCFGKTKE